MLTPMRRDSSPIEIAPAAFEGATERIEKLPLDPVATSGCSTANMSSQVDDQTRLEGAEANPGGIDFGQSLLAGGGVLGALAASSCCLVPLALFGIGVGGTWIGYLTRLAPYQPYFLGFAVVCLGIGYW